MSPLQLRSSKSGVRTRKQKAADESSSSSSSVICSVVVPAYKECENLQELSRRVMAAMVDAGWKKEQVELIVVDDNSRDGSVEVIEQLAKGGKNGQQESLPVKIIVRTKERGLSSAVLHGFRSARGLLLLCMDADLQHPPEAVPKLFAAIDDGQHTQNSTSASASANAGVSNFVIGTRYGGDGFSVDKNWPLHRQIVSKGARLLARPLSPLSDPMTGFFALPRKVLNVALENGNVNDVGFKICLELAVKTGVPEPAEVPIHFGVRVHGESKLTGKVILSYLGHLYQLYMFKFPYLIPTIGAALCSIIYYLATRYLLESKSS